MKRVVLFAPNVGGGGGLVLLRALLKAWPKKMPAVLILDQRGRDAIDLPEGDLAVHWVRSTIAGRWHAERLLAKTSRADDLIFCFHNLPPILPVSGQIFCFVQNLLMTIPLRELGGDGIRFRGRVERLIMRCFRFRIDCYIVQTATTAESLRQAIGADKTIVVMPFVDPTMLPNRAGADFTEGDADSPEFDFLYVSDGEPHKNHLRLIQAWELLANQGCRPSLAITLHPVRDAALKNRVEQLVHRRGLRIVDLGQVPHDQLLRIYGRSRALLFASFAESFGLPLVEAESAGLPILAPELDYVRDVCDPAETFDPHSTRSIARAVRRFLRHGPEREVILPPDAFLASLFEYAEASVVKQSSLTGRSKRAADWEEYDA